MAIRTDRGEGRFVSIRGTAPNRNNVTFNGQAVASAAGTRATALDLVPSEMVSSIEVAKAVTPDMDANALGGSVNVTTLTAFDREGRFLSASFNGMVHQLTTDWGDTRPGNVRRASWSKPRAMSPRGSTSPCSPRCHAGGST